MVSSVPSNFVLQKQAYILFYTLVSPVSPSATPSASSMEAKPLVAISSKSSVEGKTALSSMDTISSRSEPTFKKMKSSMQSEVDDIHSSNNDNDAGHSLNDDIDENISDDGGGESESDEDPKYCRLSKKKSLHRIFRYSKTHMLLIMLMNE